MMFAKLFERDGDQVLVMKSKSDDKEPILNVIFEVLGTGKATVSVFFDSEEDLDEALGIIDEDQAFEVRDAQVEQCNEMLGRH